MKTNEIDISEESQCASAAGDFKPAARRSMPTRMFSQATGSFTRTYLADLVCDEKTARLAARFPNSAAQT
jgi:hypothetical protein